MNRNRSERFSPPLSPPRSRAFWRLTATIGTMLSCVGCASLNPWKDDDEYSRAKNAIDGYEDRDGNWIRPEGARANRPVNSDLPKFLQDIPGLGQRPINKESARTKYREADQLFEKAKSAQGTDRRDLFRKAAKQYQAAGKDWASSALEQDAMFMAAESYFFAEDYPKAENHYVKLVKEYPRTRWQDQVDRRRMEIGHYWLQFPDKFYNVNFTDNKRPLNDTENHGKRVLEKMRLDSPTSRLADDVTMEIANTEFKRENWPEALDAYRDLITVYPDSPHQFDAHFLGAKSALLAYQGAQYTSEPLDQAEKLLSQMVKQFSDKSQENKDQIREMIAEVKFRKAERLYEESQYRANRQEYNAAKIYADKILENYEDTPFADKAREIVAKADGKPAVPTPYMNWMTTVFPTRDKIGPIIKAAEESRAKEPTGVMASGDGPIRR
ncbi:MAG: outer membrane protein assembly factor BamD [Planctomycetota bacterium]